ncbi:Testis-expressed sequence 12 protein [Heterocephalus glaber]|uniref:Testis-expressed sequence 12 protein n=1 Tax=Heterocephalus glaber TaxID=10181 RepID=G5CAZ2_HETGA|nr:Testis-expressed sequence 12 protein [Heterocephalus glaber]
MMANHVVKPDSRNCKRPREVERAAVDGSYLNEIDELFKEADIIENFLIQKREHLRQRLTVITNTLKR